MGPDLVGYIASGLVLLTFTAKSMLTLRILAILSNFAFIFYGIIDSITPVLCLHAILLPLNITRLAQLLACRKRSRPGLWQIRSYDSGAKRSVGRNHWAAL
jgi:CRP/FNR family transcriptional regulator, cyclic AMP receptor protein